MRITAVIPTRNEAASVPGLVAELMALPLDLSLLFVDDQSPDGTAKAVRAAAKRHPGRSIHVIERPKGPRGLGLAYRDGFREALLGNPDAVLQMDADGQHPPSILPQLAAAMAGPDQPDLVIASRYAHGGSARSFSLGRGLVSRLGSWVGRTLLRLPVRDLTGGFKLWRADLLAQLAPGTAESRGYVFQIEMTLRAHRMGATIREVPFEFASRTAGESKMSIRIAFEAAGRIFRWALRPPKVPRYHPPGRASQTPPTGHPGG